MRLEDTDVEVDFQLPEELSYPTRHIALTRGRGLRTSEQSIPALRSRVLWFVLPTYVLTVAATLGLVYLHALGILTVPAPLLSWLGPAVIGEFVSSVGVVIAFLFSRRT